MRRTFPTGVLLFSLFTIGGFAQMRSGFSGGINGIRVPTRVGPNIGALGRPIPNPAITYNGYGRGNRYGNGYGIAAYPIYIGGFSGDYYPGYLDGSLGAAPPPAPAAPPVVINQYFGTPAQAGPPPEDSSVQIYSPQSRTQGDDPAPAPQEPRSYLIAYKDHSVYSALAYWVEDHTLHYVTMQNTHNQADLGLIDLDFTRKLNQDRNMAFSITPSKTAAR